MCDLRGIQYLLLLLNEHVAIVTVRSALRQLTDQNVNFDEASGAKCYYRQIFHTEQRSYYA